MEDLSALLEIVEKWQKVQNLVSRETPGDLWRRHVLDSLQLLPMIGGARTILDLGSGGGFPALPLAIALKGSETAFTLVEANGRKCAFLNAAKRDLGLMIHVKQARIEAFAPNSAQRPDLITARALAPLPLLVTYARRLAGPHTRALFHKGREYGEELAQVDSALQGSVIVKRSLTDPEAVILEWPTLVQPLAPVEPTQPVTGDENAPAHSHARQSEGRGRQDDHGHQPRNGPRRYR